VRNEASSGCASRLTGYLNPQLAISLAQSYVFPNRVAWTGGTRTVICEVQAVSGQLTQSVRGASLPVVKSCHVLAVGDGHYAGCPLWTTDFSQLTPFA
jgi:hypothetical protein